MLYALYIFLQVWVGIFAFLFALPLVPGAMDSLLIVPNRYKPEVWPPNDPETRRRPNSRSIRCLVAASLPSSTRAR